MTRGRVKYSVGNETNPGNPFGRSELVIEPDGRATLEHHARGLAAQTFAGAVAAAELDRLWAALDRAGFPNVPKHPIPGGSTMRVLGVDQDTVHVEFYAAKKLAGYDEAFALLDDLIRHISGGAVART